MPELTKSGVKVESFGSSYLFDTMPLVFITVNMMSIHTMEIKLKGPIRPFNPVSIDVFTTNVLSL